MSVRPFLPVLAALTLTLAACSHGGSSASPAPRTATSPAGSAPAAATDAVTAGAVADSKVTITSPKEGAAVQHCAVVAGTAALAPGKTVVLSMKNLDNGDDTHYYAPVSNWETAQRLAHWTGNQYFGSGNDSVGQKYELEALVVDTSVVKPIIDSKKDWNGVPLPTGAVVKDRVELKRVAGNGPIACN